MKECEKAGWKVGKDGQLGLGEGSADDDLLERLPRRPQGFRLLDQYRSNTSLDKLSRNDRSSDSRSADEDSRKGSHIGELCVLA